MGVLLNARKLLCLIFIQIRKYFAVSEVAPGRIFSVPLCVIQGECFAPLRKYYMNQFPLLGKFQIDLKSWRIMISFVLVPPDGTIGAGKGLRVEMAPLSWELGPTPFHALLTPCLPLSTRSQYQLDRLLVDTIPECAELILQ